MAFQKDWIAHKLNLQDPCSFVQRCHWSFRHKLWTLLYKLSAQPSKENLTSVEATYEDTFMPQVRSLGATRQGKAPERFHHVECFTSESLTDENEEAESVKDTLGGNNSEKWKEALDAEYSSLTSNEKWELVPPPKDANRVGSKWVLKLKRDADGNINRYKARLVAQRYSQTQGVDYEEILSCCQILKYQITACLGKCIWL